MSCRILQIINLYKVAAMQYICFFLINQDGLFPRFIGKKCSQTIPLVLLVAPFYRIVLPHKRKVDLTHSSLYIPFSMLPVLRSMKVDLLNPLFIFFLYVTSLEKYESWSTQSSLYLPFSMWPVLRSMKVDKLNPLWIFLSLCYPLEMYSMKVDLLTPLYIFLSLCYPSWEVFRVLYNRKVTNLDLLTVEVGNSDGLDEPFLHEFLHGQPSRRRVGVVKPKQG